jgi:hypothetical protein
MEFDLLKEELITLSQAASLLPRRRLGRKCSTSCLHRWAVRGLRGQRLRVVQVGGVRCTSRQELHRFFEALSQSAYRSEAEFEPPRRDDRAEAVGRELDGLGL